MKTEKDLRLQYLYQADIDWKNNQKATDFITNPSTGYQVWLEKEYLKTINKAINELQKAFDELQNILKKLKE